MPPLEPTPSESPSPADRPNAVAPPPIVPLSVAQRRDLQRRFERAWQLMQQSSARTLDAHRELLACLAADPASALYVDALLLNLRKPAHRNRKSFWLGRWARQARVVAAALRGDWSAVLTHAPELLLEDPRHLPLFLALIDAHHARGHRESAWRYVEETFEFAENNVEVRRRAARVRMSRGHFAAARVDWRFVAHAIPADPEAAHYLDLLPAEPADERPRNAPPPSDLASFEQELQQLQALRDAGRWTAAESRLADARARHGSRLELRQFGDELALARHSEQCEVARKLADSEARRGAATASQIELATHLWRSLANELTESLARLEVEILAGRCRLLPRDADLHARLAGRLETLGNWPEAARCWEIAATAPDDAQAAVALHRLGEVRQRQRQFGPALACYRASLQRGGPAAGTSSGRRQTLAHASRLARALGREEEAREYDRQLAGSNPGRLENHGSSAEGP